MLTCDYSNFQPTGYTDVGNWGFPSRKREFGDVFDNWDDSNAKRVKSIIVDDEYSLGRLLKPRLTENALAMPQVMNYDVGPENMYGFSTEELENASRMVYGDNWISQGSEGGYVSQENSHGLYPVLRDDSAGVFYGNHLTGQGNSYGLAPELTDGSAGMFYENHFTRQENSYGLLPELTDASSGMFYENHLTGKENSYGLLPELTDASSGMIYKNHLTGQENTFGLLPELTDDSARMYYENHMTGQVNSFGLLPELTDCSAGVVYENHLIGQEYSYGIAPEFGSAGMVYENHLSRQENSYGLLPELTDDSVRMFYGNRLTGQGNCYGLSPDLTDCSAGVVYENHLTGQGYSYGIAPEFGSAGMVYENHLVGQEYSYGIAPESKDGSSGMVNGNLLIGQESKDNSRGQENIYGVVTEAIDDSAHVICEDRCIGHEDSCGVVTEAIDDSAHVIYEDRCIGHEDSCGVAPEVECGTIDNSVDCEENMNGVVTEAIDDSTHVLYEDRCIGHEDTCGVAPEVECGTLDNSVDCEVVENIKCESETNGSNVSCVSLTDSLTVDQLTEHLRSLMKPDGIHVDENTCQLCGNKDIMFAPPPIDCAHCGCLIKPGSTCYRTEDEKYSFCTTCFKNCRGNISVKDQSFPKKVLIKGNNVAVTAEAWVRCDKCRPGWQHQICALYNRRHDVNGTMTYTCPICRLTEREAMPNMPVTPILGARDLPRTILSDHLEQRLCTKLAHERAQRAESMGLAVDEVPGVEDLVIRTVLSVDRQIKVNSQFVDILHGEKYPSNFPYKSQVIMLFQKIDGAEVCLFAMFVQEFGSECGQPNQRSVYISYIDSVNYFTPDIKAANDQPLRTFVYHEILIGYLDYCKKRGFNTCYIWACPPVKGVDYIFYCHPGNQKTPQPAKLRKWYTMMLDKAVEDNVVSKYSNFYEYFFVPRDNQNTKITAARLPYIDGSFWTGAIENMLEKIRKKCNGDSKKKSVTKRTLKSMGHDDPSVDAAKDIQVMKALEEDILPFKEDMFVVQLAQSRDRLRTTDTNDNDIIVDNDIFENRGAFLTFCQDNNYQFDTLRRAKHSSMMILDTLHKTTG